MWTRAMPATAGSSHQKHSFPWEHRQGHTPAGGSTSNTPFNWIIPDLPWGSWVWILVIAHTQIPFVWTKSTGFVSAERYLKGTYLSACFTTWEWILRCCCLHSACNSLCPCRAALNMAHRTTLTFKLHTRKSLPLLLIKGNVKMFGWCVPLNWSCVWALKRAITRQGSWL